MKVNSTLEELNLESNFLTRDGIVDLLSMITENTTLKEFKLSNQVCVISNHHFYYSS